MIVPQLVRVLVEGVYNDGDHRSNGWSKPGDIITVAGGAYFDSLFNDDLVKPVTEEEARQKLDEELEALSAELDAANDSPENESDDPDGPADDSATAILESIANAPDTAKGPKSRRTQRLV